MMTTKVFAPAKVNLTLHVTGQRPDGYHLLDSLVVFADVGDIITATLADEPSLTVSGPMGTGVPEDASNLILRVADWMGVNARFHLEKHLPNAAGIGGGSSDAAAALRALKTLTHRSWPCFPEHIGADVPVCLHACACRMTGVGEEVAPVSDFPELNAVLVNSGQPVSTPDVFRALVDRNNPPMPEVLPTFQGAADVVSWLAETRNDLQTPAIVAEPGIARVLVRVAKTRGCELARMTGSGGTCFGLYRSAEQARAAAAEIVAAQPGWWVVPAVLS